MKVAEIIEELRGEPPYHEIDAIVSNDGIITDQFDIQLVLHSIYPTRKIRLVLTRKEET